MANRFFRLFSCAASTISIHTHHQQHWTSTSSTTHCTYSTQDIISNFATSECASFRRLLQLLLIRPLPNLLLVNYSAWLAYGRRFGFISVLLEISHCASTDFASYRWLLQLLLIRPLPIPLLVNYSPWLAYGGRFGFLSVMLEILHYALSDCASYCRLLLPTTHSTSTYPTVSQLLALVGIR